MTSSIVLCLVQMWAIAGYMETGKSGGFSWEVGFGLGLQGRCGGEVEQVGSEG